MSWDWAYNLLSNTGAVVSAGNGVGTTTGIVNELQSTLQYAIPVIWPAVIAVAILFGGYAILKRLYHSKF